MAYGTLKSDVVQSSTAGTPPQFNDGNGTQTGTLCRAWVSFVGSPSSIRSSFNVSSVTRNGTGDYSITFATSMSDANYSSTAMCQRDSGAGYNGFGVMIPATTSPTNSVLRILTGIPSGAIDSPIVNVSVFR